MRINIYTCDISLVLSHPTYTLLNTRPPAFFSNSSPSSKLSPHNKLTLYKLLIRPVLTYAAPVWSETSSSNYRHLQILQSKCLRVIGNYPRYTPISHLHSALNLEPIHKFIYRLKDKFFNNCSTHPNPLVRQTGNYTLSDLHKQYRKYIHKWTKHLLL